jgi:uncharacterized membrane protein YdjX (TVP38/TMEM64 family)
MKILHTKLKKNRRGVIPEITAADLPENAGTSLRDKLLGAVILVAATALFVWLTAILFRPLFVITTDPDRFGRFIKEQGAVGRVAFFGIQILQGFLPIPLELTTVAGGYAFGRVQGSLLTVAATMLSTTAIFYFTKIFGRKLLDLFFTPAQQQKVKYFRDEKVHSAVTWFVFLIPGMPKRMFVFTAGLVPQSFGKFLLISTIARTPAIVACSFGGHALSNGNYAQAVTIFIITGVMGIGGILLYNYFTTRKNKIAR